MAIIWAGLALGFAHAFEADHIAAVTTMAADPLRDRAASRMAPVLWAVGHALAVFALGMLAVGLGSALPLGVSTWAERLVGPLLIFLGGRTMFRSGLLHQHTHTHMGHRHVHYHLHLGAGHHHPDAAGESAPPARHTPLFVGALHGMAGTGGALILAASAGFAGAAHGALFLTAFGLSTIAAMSLYSGAFSLVTSRLARRAALAQVTMLVCGLVSAGLGLYLLTRTFLLA